VIIYTGKDLGDSEIKELERDSKSIILKSAKSPERLFDETMMFLHRLQKDLPPEKRGIVENLHDPTRILKGKSVLVVDDDPRNIQSLTHLLEDHGVQVYEAENGKAALSWLEGGGQQIDIILMDMMMPEMDGYEATRYLRRNPKFKNLPVVALTARAMKGERERCLEAGCDDYLSKPIENDKLISLLRVWLYRST
jgi:CheY-like chemotaxis protein